MLKKKTTFTEDELNAAASAEFNRGWQCAFDHGRESVEWEGKRITERYALLKKRKQDMVIKMVDAIAQGRVEQLLAEWDDPTYEWGER